MKHHLGSGIICWTLVERQTARYGALHLASSDYDKTVTFPATLDVKALEALRGSRVRLTCVVREARKSGHIGDKFFGIVPEQPNVGEVIDLGVGDLFAERSGQFDDDLPEIVLRPGDGREEQWLDPRKLYRLHDQTVDVFVDTTEDDYTVPDLVTPVREDGVVATGDGHYQMRRAGQFSKIAPKVTRLGEGAFAMTLDFADGEQIKTIK